LLFKYVGIDESGKKLKQKVEATSLEEAKAKIKAKKILLQSISQESASLLENFSFSMRYKIPPKELSALSRELSMYIRSGISIVSAIKIVQTHYQNNKKIALFLSTVGTHLDEGKNFYTALEEQSVVELPEFSNTLLK
jgi:type IV pilus assembly protein PilC